MLRRRACRRICLTRRANRRPRTGIFGGNGGTRYLQRVLKPLRYQMPMAAASTRLDISGALMTKQNQRSTESEQAIPDLGRVESIQNVGVSYS
jgi:hypothetical protein